MLARASRVVRIVRHARRWGNVAVRLEMRRSEDLRLVLLGTLFDVGLDVELAARLEQSGDRLEEDVAHDEALGVTLLPPRVGEMKKRALERAGRAEPRERFFGIFG